MKSCIRVMAMKRIWCIAAVLCVVILSAGCASGVTVEPVRRVVLMQPLIKQYHQSRRAVLVPEVQFEHRAQRNREKLQSIHTNNWGHSPSNRGYRPKVSFTDNYHRGFTIAAPLTQMIMTSPFGERRSRPARSGGGLRNHNGIDLRARIGIPVKAPRDSVVRSIYHSGGYGLVVELDHGSGWISLFAHLSQVDVYRGQRVRQGQTIALTGNSGKTTGPHLHWELRHQGRAVDPKKHLRW